MTSSWCRLALSSAIAGAVDFEIVTPERKRNRSRKFMFFGVISANA